MKRNDFLKNVISTILIAMCIGSFVTWMVFLFPSMQERLNNLVYDTWLKSSIHPPENPSVAIVDIDEASIRKTGQLPWPRIIIAELVDILNAYGVKAIGLDIWLTESDRSSPVVVDSLLEKYFERNLDLTGLPSQILDNDRYFRDRIKDKPVVLGAHASFSGAGDFPARMPKGADFGQLDTNDSAMPEEDIAQIKGLISPLPLFINSCPVALLNVTTQDDGIVRSIPLLSAAGNIVYPALSLATLMAGMDTDKLALRSTDTNLDYLVLDDKKGQKEYAVPLGKDGSFQPVYYGHSHTLPYFSATDILEGRVDPTLLKDKFVFVGPSAHSMQNLFSTPFDPEVPRAEIHATVAQNILSGQSIRSPRHEKPLIVLAIFLAALTGVAIFRYLSLPVYVPVYIALCGLCLGISWLVFQEGVFFPPMSPIFTLGVSAFVVLPFRYWHEQAEKRKFRHAFAQYVSPAVVSRIVSEGEELLKGEQKELTIMFTDVRGFTGISEKLSPPQLVRLLNRYFTPMTACVKARRGTLDKFIGDALMAFWNAPLPLENHSELAVQAALDMQDALEKLRPGILEEFGVNMQMGIGINTGFAHVGNMGSDDLLDYTCIGENVNLASRLEGMCKRYGVGIVVSASTRAACPKSMPFLLLDMIRVKGSAKPLKIYTPLSGSDALPEEGAAKWNAALEAYFSGDFQKARSCLENLAAYPVLRQAAALFLERCLNLEKHPVAGWDGVWIYQEK